MKRIFIAVIILLLPSVCFADIEMVRTKNTATYIVFPLQDTNEDLKSSATGLDSEIDENAEGGQPDGWADCTNEATEIGSTGWYYLSLTSGEMNYDIVHIQIKSSDAKTQKIKIRTNDTGE